jgi:hypothetical protein
LVGRSIGKMLNYLVDGPPAEPQERALRAALYAGPWGWPTGNSRALARAERIAPTKPSSPKPGDVLLVTRHETGGSLWVFGPGRGSSHSLHAAQFNAVGQAAWSAAVAAAPKSVDFLWQGLPRVRAEQLRAERIATNFTEIEAAENLLKGESFGLSFLLSAVSSMTGIPVRARFAASATVSGVDGQLGTVDFLSEKLRVVSDWAPSVEEMLVANGQADPRPLQDTTLPRLVHFGSSREAVKYVFGDEIIGQLLAAGENGERREEAVNALVALIGRGQALTDWTPVANAAMFALTRWHRVSDADANELQVVAAVASRHASRRGTLPRMSVEQLGSIGQVRSRMDAIAQRLQSAVDSGVVDPPGLVRLAQDQLPPNDSADDHHLGMKGALARLLAVTGYTHDAHRFQREAAECFLNPRSSTGASAARPLCEWYRLAGCLADYQSFVHAEISYSRLRGVDGLNDTDLAYLALARSQASLLLAHSLDDADLVLNRLATTEGRLQIRWSAARWLIRLLTSCGRSADSDAVMRMLEAASSDGDHVAAGRLALVHLDAADKSKAGDAKQALDALRQFYPGLVRNLEHAAVTSQTTLTIPAYVAHWFPY